MLAALFAAYQLYRTAVAALSPSNLGLALFDLLIIALTAVEYVKLRSHPRRVRHTSPTHHDRKA